MTTAITVLNKANVPTGPFTREQVEQRLKSGEFSASDLAFVEGLSQWTPLGEVMERIVGVVEPVLPPPAFSPPSVPPVGVPAYSYAATMQPPVHLEYAGFWLRLAAILVDGLVFSPFTIISFFLRYEVRTSTEMSTKIFLAVVLVVFGLFNIIARWLYFALMESSSWQATVGKKALGLKVTTLDGQRIGFGRATGRYFGKFISTLTLMIGWMMAGFTERKQALHDMIAGTLVVKK